MEHRLTLKQRKFVAYLLGSANGNQTLAARLAGYRGDDRQLGVQGSVNVRNPQIQQMLNQALDKMVEPSLKRLKEGLDAKKRRAFVTKAGDIVYTDLEPDYRVRTATAKQILDRYERSLNGYGSGSDADVIPGREDGAEPQEEVADDAKTGGCADDGIVAQLDPADRVLVERATDIEAELAQLEREVDGDGHNGGEQ